MKAIYQDNIFGIKIRKNNYPKHFWQNKKNFDNDYKYLDILHEKILKKLSKILNKIHNETESLNYWRIILDPWLQHYLGMSLFLWRIKDKLKKKKRLNNYNIIFNHSYYLSNQRINGNYHEYILNNILSYKYKIKKEKKTIYYVKTHIYRENKKNFLKKIIFFIFSKIFKKNFLFFLDSGFDFIHKLKLFFLLKKKIIFIQNFGDYTYKKSDFFLRKKRAYVKKYFSFKTENNFEKYILQNFHLDLLSDFLEYYLDIKKFSTSVKFLSKYVIITNISLNISIVKKFFLAYLYSKNSKIIFVPHGGSIPLEKDQYIDLQNKISHYNISECKTIYRPNQIYLPTINLKKVKKIKFDRKINKKLTFCFDEDSFYTFHLRSSSHFGDTFDYYNKIIKLVMQFKKEIKSSVNFKLYHIDYGWNIKKNLLKLFDQSSISNKQFLEETFIESKIIVHSNIETAFYQTLLSGVPTLIYTLPNKYSRNKKFNKILNEMREKKLLIDNMHDLNNHINSIWNDPILWWESVEIKKLRNKIINNVIFKSKKSELFHWYNFLKKLN